MNKDQITMAVWAATALVVLLMVVFLASSEPATPAIHSDDQNTSAGQ